MGLKRINVEVSCEFCGKTFKQTRWWQVFCSRRCKESSSATAKSEVRDLRAEVQKLRLRIKELENNAGTHSGTRKYEPKPFKYDDENQDVYGED